MSIYSLYEASDTVVRATKLDKKPLEVEFFHGNKMNLQNYCHMSDTFIRFKIHFQLLTSAKYLTM